MTTQNLWGSLKDVEIVRTPKTILKEQAQILSEETQGILVGHVSESEYGGGNFSVTLEIQVPAINNYTYEVLNVRHNIDVYPAEVNATRPFLQQRAEDEGEFIRLVEEILSSNEMRQVVSRLLSQAT